MAIVSFKDPGVEDVLFERETAQARKSVNQEVWGQAKRKMEQLVAATCLGDLRGTGLCLEELTREAKYRGYHSIRASRKWRIVFRWTPKGAEEVHVVSYKH